MNEGRLNGLASLFIHKVIVLDKDTEIDEFKKKKLEDEVNLG